MNGKNRTRVPLEIVDPTKGRAERKRLPGYLMVIDHVTGHTPSTPQNAPVAITKENFEKVIAALKITLALEVPNRISGKSGDTLAVNLKFTRGPKHFGAQTIEQVPVLSGLSRKRKALIALKTRLRNDPRLAAQVKSLLSGNAADLEKLIEMAGSLSN
jgi:type VI secretion system ImpB/VipA family protein